MFAAIVGSTVSIVAIALIKPFALQAVLFFVKTWTHIYTRAVPEKEREDRRAEIESDLHEQVNHLRAEGYTRSETAAHLLCRSVLGMKDDLVWSAPYMLNTLADNLVKGSGAIKRCKYSPKAVGVLGGFLLIGSAFTVTPDGVGWTERLLLGAASAFGALIVFNLHKPWAQRTLALVAVVGGALVAVDATPLVLEDRLHEVPLFSMQAFGLGVAALSAALVVVVVSNECRARVFGGHWWPVLLSWGFIVAASTGAASLVGVGLDELIALWTAMALMAASLAVAVGASTLAAAVGWHGTLWGSAAGMRWVAAGIRRLT